MALAHKSKHNPNPTSDGDGIRDDVHLYDDEWLHQFDLSLTDLVTKISGCGNEGKPDEREEEKNKGDEGKNNKNPPPNVPRGRGRPKGYKKGESQKPLTARSTLIESRCCVDTAMKFFYTEVFHRLTAEHKEILAGTPFLHLFCFPEKTQVSSPVLHYIISSWDGDEGVFWFKVKKFKFRAEEVSFMMGLAFDGSPVQYDRSSLMDSTVRNKYFDCNVIISGGFREQDKGVVAL